MSGGNRSTRASRPPCPPDPPNDYLFLPAAAALRCSEMAATPSRFEEDNLATTASEMSTEVNNNGFQEKVVTRAVIADGQVRPVWEPVGAAQL